MVKKLKKINKGANLKILYLLGLILALATAIPTYIQSNFIGQFVSLTGVSIFFVVSNLITFFVIIFFPNFIKKLTNYFLTKIVLAVYGASLLALSIADNTLAVFVSFLFLSISSNLIWINMDFFIESFSSDAKTGRIRTIYFTFINLGWILAPLFSSYLIKRGNYSWPFLAAALVLIPFYLIFIYHGRGLQDKVKYHKINIRRTLKNIWANRNLRGVFSLSLLLNLFFNSAVVFIPIYLHQNLGLSWDQLGLVFAFMLLPFILFEIPAGIIADKKLCEKEIFQIGFSILIISLLSFFWVKSNNVLIWAFLLFFSRIGASLIEAMRESYFFRIVDVADVEYIDFFRTSTPLGYLIGSALGIIVFKFYSLENLFLILAIVMLSSFYFLHLMKNNKMPNSK
ncbi:MAG: MFS transporter [Candidatus Falkowbacteria bacterium]|nr:MFS transporter [Candidatus Falkowbacteria bacterium]